MHHQEIFWPFNQNNAIKRGSIQIDLSTHVGKRGELIVSLTPREIDLLGFMHDTFTKASLIDEIYRAFGERISKSEVSCYLSRLRKKLGKDVFLPIRMGEFQLNDKLPDANDK